MKDSKTAVVYSKWLASLGGGEVVACNIAAILRDLNYEVLLISGKRVTRQLVEEKLGINLKGIKIIQNWNNEPKLKEIISGKDLFVNTSYMDYSFGYAKQNIYYTHFPTSAYDNFKGFIFNNILLPVAAKLFKPVELIDEIRADSIHNGKPAYLLQPNTKIAISYLEEGKVYLVSFKIFFENFYKSLLESFKCIFQNAEVLNLSTYVEHHRNEIKFTYKIKAAAETIYLNIHYQQLNIHFLPKDRLYLIFPKVSVSEVTNNIVIENVYKIFYNRVATRLRAGLFVNILQRMRSYSGILCNSEFTSNWVNKYWGLKSAVCYPPVDLLCKKKILFNRKKNWICSVGRFFTLGHGKKQEILIQAFKKLYDSGNISWELHLIGGLANDPSNIDYLNKLKSLAKGYPVYFHLNISRKELEHIYHKSKIYWHATGFGENQETEPILFEHFGIAPVEAISAGCIPILYNGGGLPEIIDRLSLNSERNLFSTISELVKNTIYFTKEKNNIDWSKVFDLLNKNFSIDSFKKNIINIISN